MSVGEDEETADEPTSMIYSGGIYRPESDVSLSPTGEPEPVKESEPTEEQAEEPEADVEPTKKKGHGFWSWIRRKNQDTMAGIRDATGNPDWESEIIVLQAEAYHRRGRLQESIAANPEMDAEDRRWARGRLDARDEKYIQIDPNATIQRKRDDVSSWREWAKWLIIASIAMLAGGSFMSLFF